MPPTRRAKNHPPFNLLRRPADRGRVVRRRPTPPFVGPAPELFFHRRARARSVAVTGPQRTADYPDVPTFKESGIDLGGIEGGTWFGIVASTATPALIVEKLNGAVTQALKDPKTRFAFEKVYGVVAGGTSSEFGALLQSQQKFWREALDAAGVRPN